MPEVLTDKDGDEDVIEIVEVDALPPAGAATPPAKDAVEDDEDDDDAGAGDGADDNDDEDERLAASDDDVDDAIASKSRQNKLKRRERQKAARERTERELQEMRRAAAAMAKRLEALEGGAAQQTVQQIEAELAAAQAEITQAEAAMAAAVEAGDGAAAAEALRLRDAARDREAMLKVRKDQRNGGPKQPRQRDVLAQAWMTANPWFKVNGTDATSAVAKTIDVQLQNEGYNPDDIGFWQELSRRVTAHFNPAAKADEKRKKPKEAAVDDTDPPRRKGPPVGGGRGAKTPLNGSNVVHVTPERKQAMIDAGAWEDPERRKRMLKAYRDFDRQNASR